ncbi:unnamed protein product [Bursaphelenchus okinawaensis]|uniref:CDP-diacylglycerol--glycerol-3-phosphate 3-phosphatidyltransferase n=1 Tax=Bursaphelenchus okinawaensis TaxID=465554 RepID=A0A811L8J7_9BILA|nr:unnamed protein product [Bursaphelenchus okinawaensis]CAG9119872.1 unnamed protein product [Bursaphelenchus okinawaensis]
MNESTITEGFHGVSVESESIYFLKTPEEFYNTLIDKLGAAKKRVYLSALYLGTGELEQSLVTKLEDRVNKNDEITVKLLFDYLRGTRGGEKSSVGILKHLSDKIEAYFFHTPNLRGILKKYMPERVNEIVGLQHMKFFIFDDTIIISGANLSDTYFTNRQDRYVVIENSPELVDFFVTLFEAVSSCSFQLKSDGSLEPKCDVHPFKGKPDDYKDLFLSKTNDALSKLGKFQETTETLVYPVVQMGSFKIREEERLMKNIFRKQDVEMDITLATGYLNLYDQYSDLMLNESNCPIDIVFASPEANGFHKAKGISGYIPALYVYISELLLRKINQLGRKIRLLEYQKPGWSFHGKGMWINSKTDDYTATVIGSSNFGYRSTTRDLEAQLVIVTRNEVLKRRINEEKSFILENTRPLDHVLLAKPDHYVPFWMSFLMTSGGLLIREFVKRVKPVERHGALVPTRGFYTSSSKRTLRRRAKPVSVDPFSPAELKQRMGGFSARRLASTSAQSYQNDAEQWIPVYRFTKIGMCFMVARAKFYQTIASIALIPYETYRMTMGSCDLQEYFTVCGLAFLAPCVLMAFANTFNKLVGVVSFNPETEEFRFGYLSFWGRRTNKLVKYDEIYSLLDTHDPTDKKVILKMDFSDGDSLFIPTNSVQIVDETLAKQLFGDLTFFKKLE